MIAEAALSWGGVDGALHEDVLASEESSGHGMAGADGGVVGVGAVAEGITSCEVMAGEASGTS